MDVVVRSRRVVTPQGMGPAAIHIANGTITRLAAWDDAGPAPVDHGEHAILPGIVDTHVHVNEPGRTEWEGFATATRAAAIGGVTTVVDMPLNSIPPTTTREAFAAKRAAARGQCSVDVGFWGGVVPGNQGELAGLVTDGVRGFKCFLVDSGVPEFGWVGEAELAPAMAILAGLGAPLLVHAELAGPIDAATAQLAGADPHRYATYLASRPPAAEDEAIELVTRLCRATRARTHIVHHSAACALGRLREARAEGLPLTAETCPHYLHFTAEAIPDGATAVQVRAADPRCREPRGAVGRARRGRARSRRVAITRHARPRSRRSISRSAARLRLRVGRRRGAAARAAGRVDRGHAAAATRSSISRAGCAPGPARLAGLAAKKGAIAVGHDADLVVFADDERVEVTPAAIQHRHQVTP